ncbi:hypothetical protein FKR81_00185 [Lentzea tibetensis]|uniref:RES domain-containing protein n=1 Tax=Lentzea tibetensis TaxID=2591470 RepID=A0A563F2R4_9PSEU|nr:hypothetical protein [Lentzea tibetensis]TWP54028.1 hypothetical protein FKR81_00185 [Lentzea tibetensis]
MGKSWGRFDIAEHATLYGASEQRGAYVESLAYAELRTSALPLHEIFPDVDENDDPVAADWNTLFHMSPGRIPAEWREIRQLAEVFLCGDEYFVDLAEAENLGVLRRSVREWSPARYHSNRIDLSDLLGGDRQLTCAAAAWLSTCTLTNGSRPRGVRYVSKHGVNLSCWALWAPVRHGEDVEQAVRRHVRRGRTLPVDPADRQLMWAASQLGLKVW